MADVMGNPFRDFLILPVLTTLLGGLAAHQVPSPRATTHDFARSSDLETLRD